MSDQTTTGRRLESHPSPLDHDDDLLGEILLGVPPQPSSLPRASLVCKRWRRLAADPWCLRRLRSHHRKAPLLGFFQHHLIFSKRRHIFPEPYRIESDFAFYPNLERPDRVPPQRLSPGRGSPAGAGEAPATCRLLSCRHGRVIFLDRSDSGVRVFVCDPVTGGQVRLDKPPEFSNTFINGTVLCAAGSE